MSPHGRMHAPIDGPASIGVMRYWQASSVLYRQNEVQTPGVVVPPSGIASMGRQRPPAHSLFDALRLTMHPAPIGLPAIGVSHPRPDENTHLHLPQSAPDKQKGKQEKSISARVTRPHTKTSP